MSDISSALGGATVAGRLTIRDTGPRGMVTLRGDLRSAALGKAVKAGAGTEVPGRRDALFEGERGALWMSPDELLILTPYDEAAAATQAMTKALAGAHALAVEVSDARSVLALEGAEARETLAKLAPVDLHPGAFGPGMIRRTHLGQVAAAFWMTGENAFEIMCFRSVAVYVFDSLVAASAEGAAVGIF